MFWNAVLLLLLGNKQQGSETGKPTYYSHFVTFYHCIIYIGPELLADFLFKKKKCYVYVRFLFIFKDSDLSLRKALFLLLLIDDFLS